MGKNGRVNPKRKPPPSIVFEKPAVFGIYAVSTTGIDNNGD